MDATASAGVLAFEMSAGKHRLIVNCGASPGDKKWGAALKATAAHPHLSSTTGMPSRWTSMGCPPDGRDPSRRAGARTAVPSGSTWSRTDTWRPTACCIAGAYLSPTARMFGAKMCSPTTGSRGDTERSRDPLPPSSKSVGDDPSERPASCCGCRRRWLASDQRRRGGSRRQHYFGAGGSAQRTSQIVVRRSLEDVRSSGELKIRWPSAAKTRRAWDERAVHSGADDRRSGPAGDRCCFHCGLVGTCLLIEWLIRREIIDRPNERSSYETPTPRGGGIAVIAAIIAATISYGLTTEGLALSMAVALTAAVQSLRRCHSSMTCVPFGEIPPGRAYRGGSAWDGRTLSGSECRRAR